MDWTVFGMADPILNCVFGATFQPVHCMEQAEFAIPRSECEDRAELIRYASTFVFVPNMFEQVAVALLLLAGITFVYVIGIRQRDPHDEIDEEGRLDRTR